MSWREILGTKNIELIHPHNSQNTQNEYTNNSSAYIANIVESESKLLEVLASICRDLTISPSEVRNSLAKEDLTDWCNSKISRDTLFVFAKSHAHRKELNQGKVPSHYKKIATCIRCGPIWYDTTATITSCPWCYNRLANKPIPRPIDTCCIDCKHFERIDHPHLGHCTKGQPEAIVGLWDTDKRYCERYLPS